MYLDTEEDHKKLADCLCCQGSIQKLQKHYIYLTV